MAQGSERIAWVDCAKAIGILLIVLWHSPTQVINENYMLWVKACAVPFFFFISGFFIQRNFSVDEVLAKKAKTVLLPYLSGSLVAIFGAYALSGKQIGWGDIGGIVYGSFHYLEWGPLWFLTNLFIVVLLGHFLVLRVCNCRGYAVIVAFIFMALNSIYLKDFWLIPLGSMGGDPETLKGWPFGADIVFIGLFFYVVGFFSYKILITEVRALIWILVVSIFLINVLFNESVMDLALRRYDHFFWSSVYALSGIFFIVGLSRILSKNPEVSIIFSVIGENTLVILIFHEVIQRRLYNFTEAFGWSALGAGIVAFLLAVLIPIAVNILFLSRFRLTSLAFNSPYRPFKKFDRTQSVGEP